MLADEIVEYWEDNGPPGKVLYGPCLGRGVEPFSSNPALIDLRDNHQVWSRSFEEFQAIMVGRRKGAFESCFFVFLWRL